MINEMATKTPEKPMTKQQLVQEWLAHYGLAYDEDFDNIRRELGISMKTILSYPWVKSKGAKHGRMYYTVSSRDPIGRPMSRFESSGYGLNFRLVPRLENVLYKELN